VARVEAQRETRSSGFLQEDHHGEHKRQARARPREAGDRREDQSVGGAGESAVADDVGYTKEES